MALLSILRIQKLKYLEPTDIIKKFETFTNQILLDSAGEFSKDNRYTSLAVDPLCVYKLKKNKLYVNDKLIKISKKRFLNNLINSKLLYAEIPPQITNKIFFLAKFFIL